MSESVRVVLVEDHAVLAEALHISLTIKGFQVTPLRPDALSRTQDSLLTAILAADPQVAVLDLDLGTAADGARLIRPLSRGGVPVVVLTGSTEQVRWGECLERGAATVLPKTAPLHVVAEVLHRAARGLPVISQQRRQDLMRLWQAHTDVDDDQRHRLDRLTPREAYVLTGLMHGRRVREIATEAYVSEATVRTHVKSILAKLGVSSQLAAVAMARDAGWAGQPSAT